MLSVKSQKEFKQEMEARWPSKEEEALARADQEKMAERIRDMEERYAEKAILGKLKTVQGDELMPEPGTFKPKIDWNVINLPVEPAISGEFVFPVSKAIFPKDMIEEIVKVQPLNTTVGGIAQTNNESYIPLPPGTCETCLGNCVRPGSGDTCEACNGTGCAPEETLSAAEEVEARRVEALIEDILDERHDGTNKAIPVDVGEVPSKKIREWLYKRFTAWNVGYERKTFLFVPK